MDHNERVLCAQKQMKLLLEERTKNASSGCVAILHGVRPSNSTRSKGYNRHACGTLDLSDFHHVVSIDTEKMIAIVEPRVTLEELVAATLPLGLVPPVVPEFKGISVGGAISGGATESSGSKFGLFHDACTEYEILLGNGEVLRASPTENPDVFLRYPSSYGSLGPLLSCTLQLLPACPFVDVSYHSFHDPMEALDWMRQRSHSPEAPDFLDGIVFSKDLAVIIEGRRSYTASAPLFTMKNIGSEWYYQHVRRLAEQSKTPTFEEMMDLQEYLFRYDTGAFWMGSYVFSLPLVWSYIFDGLRHREESPRPHFSEKGYAAIFRLYGPSFFGRAAFSRWLSSANLWKLEHAAEKWFHNLMVIQDFCFPENRVDGFFARVLEVNIFPLWLCPIKASSAPEIFSPHVQKDSCHVINVGIYGLTPRGCDAKTLTRSLERDAARHGGRKVLYSRSYYSPEEFWGIYSRPEYEALRERMHARGVWSDIADKALSE